MNNLSLNNHKVNFRITPVLYLLIAALIVAFGQPARSPIMGVLASIFGYTFLFVGLKQWSSSKLRSWIAFGWYLVVEGVHLSWMIATEYQGLYIFWVYAFILLLEGAQFLIWYRLFERLRDPISFQSIFLLSGVWVWMEWARLFFFCGFPFNPIGLALSSSFLGLQVASLAGVYGLSWIVMATNLVCYKYFESKFNHKLGLVALLIVMAPYLYGFSRLEIQKKPLQKSPLTMRALLVQTALDPAQKTGYRGFEYMVPPIDQWALIYQHVFDHAVREVDLIVLPEAAVPLAHNDLYYPIEEVRSMVRWCAGDMAVSKLPKIPSSQRFVDNQYLSQGLANIVKSRVIIGLEHTEDPNLETLKVHAAAFCFYPDLPPEIYHKQILIPLVEYIPFKWCKKLAKKYGIEGWYQRGRDYKIFDKQFKISPSICMEEMYSFVVQKGRKAGAQVFVNISNDVWYPNSTLPRQHFDHGLLRAVENGVPVLRSCNTGVTGAVDAFGRVIDRIYSQDKSFQWRKEALYVEVPIKSFTTPYSIWGDWFVLSLSSFFIISYFFNIKRVFIKRLVHEN